MRLLIVEDEKHLAEALGQILKSHHYLTDTVYDGVTGLDYALTGIYDIILLDIMLPKMNGLQVLQTLRKARITTPVILLTAKDDVSDKVAGLDSGADDYLAKPFDIEELLARVRAVSRRKGEVVVDSCISFADLTLQPETCSLVYKDQSLTLTLKEFQLLELLIARKGCAVSKEDVLDKIWGFDSEVDANNVEVYISFLRKKLSNLKSKAQIKTLRQIGYILMEES
jgi:DNA-binding response OmpR family regulator